MAIKFYLQQIDAQHEIHCNTNSTFTELAGAFNIGTIELEWNECKHSIFPHTKFYIVEDTTNSVWNFDISEDNVEIVRKTNPVKYLHKLTISQLTHSISNIPIRNSNFTQPYSSNFKYKKSTVFAVPCYYNQKDFGSYNRFVNMNHSANTNQYLIDNYSLQLGNIKIKKGSIKIKTLYNVFTDFEETTGISYPYLLIKEPNSKIVNQNVGNIIVRFVNANDPDNDYKQRWISFNEIEKDMFLTTEEINWLERTDKFFIKIIQAEIENIDSFIPARISISGRISLPVVAGIINVELNLESFRYSLIDVINVLLKQASKNYNNEHLEYQNYIVDNIVNDVNLSDIVAPEFDFTNLDLYEAIAKVYSFIDAFPVIYEDNNGRKHISCEFLNDLTKATIENIEIVDIKTTLNEENFTNKVASYYQNGKKVEPITFPAKQFYRLPTTSKYGIADANDWYWYVSKPIDYIEEVLVEKRKNSSNSNKDNVNINRFALDFPDGIGIWNGAVYESTSQFWMAYSFFGDLNEPMKIDITNAVFSSDVYKQLPSGYAYGLTKINGQSYYKQNQNNTLYYERGGNSIYLGITGKINKTGTDDVLDYVLRWSLLDMVGIRGINLKSYETTWEYTGTKGDYPFCITYYPILDGKVSQESTINKSERETIVAQGNSGTQLNRLGNNLQGLIAKLGNEEKAITLPITKFKDKIKLGTKYVDDLGNIWIANKIQTTFTTDKENVIVNATFTRNYNALAQFTSLNQEKRFYEISERITNKGYENINEFIYFTNNSMLDYGEIAEHIAIHHFGLNAILEKTFNNSYNASVDSYNYNTELENAILTTHGKNTVWTYMPIAVYGCGNQICFEMGFDSPLAAGSRIEEYDPEGDQKEYAIKEWLYTDDEGTSDVVDIRCHFFQKGDSPIVVSYPEFHYEDATMIEILKIKDFYYYKKPNEIFHLNYALNFIPYWTKTFDELGTPQYKYEEIYFGDEFINKNGIIPHNNASKEFRLYVSNEPYSIIDNQVHGTLVNGTTRVDITSWLTDYNDNKGSKIIGRLDVYVNNAICNVSNYKSWCIADQFGNVYIAVNRQENSFNTASLRFFTSRFRKV